MSIEKVGELDIGTQDSPVLIDICEATGEDLDNQKQFIKDMNTLIDQMRIVHPKGNEFISDHLSCPKCKGKFNYTISDNINGHISGRCVKCGWGWIQ